MSSDMALGTTVIPGRAQPQPRRLLGNAAWTVGSFGVTLGLKLGSNVILTRLLMPEIFGVMVLVTTIRLGIELLTDVGVEQNIVVNKRGLEPDFFNTAWTVQIIRGAALSALFLLLTPTLAAFYQIDQSIFLVMSFTPFVNSLASTSIFGLVKNLDLKRRSLFELTAELSGALAGIAYAVVSPTVWAPVCASFVTLIVRSATSYLIPHPSHRLLLRKEPLLEILGFGKWIVISSLVSYAAANLDRVYLGKLEALPLLGIYGLARTIADLPPHLAARLSYQLVMPLVAEASAPGDQNRRSELGKARWRLVLLLGLIMGTGTAWSDLAVSTLYDSRYSAAGWMLFVLLCGAWFSMLANLNEATLVGLGRPVYNSAASAIRVLCLAAGLLLAYPRIGLSGALLVVATAEVVRYCSVTIGQVWTRYSFWRQDAMATGLAVGVLGAWIILRHGLGLDVPWNGLFHAIAFQRRW